MLSHPVALEGLLGALDEVERLVLLGDTIELLEGRPVEALAAAEPVLRAIGRRLGGEREVIIVPGNHDAALIGEWVGAQREPLGVDAAVPTEATSLLDRLASWLAPARVSARYPGVWLEPGIWATHGHYLDRHLLPESAFGIARGLLGRLPRDGATPSDYERAGGPSLTRLEALLTRWLPRPLAALIDDLAEFLRASTMPEAGGRLLGGQDRVPAGRAAGGPDATREHPRPRPGRASPRRRCRMGPVRSCPSLWAACRRRSGAMARPCGTAADREHRLLGVRATARPRRQTAASLLAGGSGRARAGPRAACRWAPRPSRGGAASLNHGRRAPRQPRVRPESARAGPRAQGSRRSAPPPARGRRAGRGRVARRRSPRRSPSASRASASSRRRCDRRSRSSGSAGPRAAARGPGRRADPCRRRSARRRSAAAAPGGARAPRRPHRGETKASPRRRRPVRAPARRGRSRRAPGSG